MESALSRVRKVENGDQKMRAWVGSWDSLQDKAEHRLYFENSGAVRNPYLYERLPSIQRLAILLSTGNMFELFVEGHFGGTEAPKPDTPSALN